MTDPILAPDTTPPSAPSAPGQSLGWPAILLLLLVSAVVLVPGMAGVSLFDRDEGWYAQVSREMVKSGDWLVPHLYGEVWLAKPPLLYWLVATSYRLFGIGEWQTRLVPALATAINVLLVAKLGAMMFNRRVGVLAGVFFVTCGVIALLGKLLLTDWVMLVFTFTAVCLHWRIAERSGRGSGFRVQEDSTINDQRSTIKSAIPNPQSAIHFLSAAYWLALGLAVLAKGPAILLFSGTFAAILLATPGRRGWIRERRWWMWLPLAIAVAAPWFLYIHGKAGPVLAQQFLLYENVARVLHPPKALHPAPPGYHLLLSLAFWLPWTVFLPRALFQALRDWRRDTAARILLLWAAIPWLILELVPSKLLWYVLPCYAPLAILLARQLEPSLCPGRTWSSLDRATQREFKLWPIVMIVLGLAGVVASFIWLDRDGIPLAIATACVLIIGFGIVHSLQRRYPTTQPAFSIGLLTVCAFYAAVGHWLLPSFEPMRLSRILSESIAAQAKGQDQVYFCGYEEPTAWFYLRTNPAKLVKKDDLPALLARHPGPLLLAITQGRLDHLDPTAFTGWQRQSLGQVAGRNYTRGFAPETICLERLVRVPPPERSLPRQLKP